MKVVNDDAEWDVALIQEFKVLITRKENRKQFLSLTGAGSWLKFPKLHKGIACPN